MPPLIYDTPHTEDDVLDKLQAMATHPRHHLELNDHTDPIAFTLDRRGWGDALLKVALLRADGRVLPVTDELTRVKASVGLTIPAGVLLAVAAVQVPAVSLAGLSTVWVMLATVLATSVIAWVFMTWYELTQALQAAFLFVPTDTNGDEHA